MLFVKSAVFVEEDTGKDLLTPCRFIDGELTDEVWLVNWQATGKGGIRENTECLPITQEILHAASNLILSAIAVFCLPRRRNSRVERAVLRPYFFQRRDLPAIVVETGYDSGHAKAGLVAIGIAQGAARIETKRHFDDLPDSAGLIAFRCLNIYIMLPICVSHYVCVMLHSPKTTLSER